MYYTKTEEKTCHFDFLYLICEFNRRLKPSDVSERIEFGNAPDYFIDEVTLKKALYELTYQIGKFPQNNLDPRDAFYHYQHLRKANKGLQIACSKNGLPVPTDFDEMLQSRYAHHKEELRKWKEAN